MSTLTQCPACGTLFRVVADQLRVSNGWVRCGSCGEAFEARKHFAAALAAEAAASPQAAQRPADLQPEPPQSAPQATEPASLGAAPEPGSEPAPPGADWRDWKAAPPRPVRTPDEAQTEPQVQPQTEDLPEVTSEDRAKPQEDITELARQAEPIEPASATFGARADAPSLTNTQSEPAQAEPTAQSPGAVTAPDFAALVAARGSPSNVEPLPPSANPKPESIGFLRDAQRRAFWRKPLVRAALGLVALALAMLLGLQLAYQERDRIAAARPELIAHLQQMCTYAKCKLRPLQSIDAIAIDSHAFNKFKGDVYRFRIALKNTSSLTAAMPAVELTLTNAQEDVIGRRVLMPLDFGLLHSDPHLKAGEEFNADLMIQLGSDLAAEQGPKRVSGYSVYTFYP